MYGNIYWNCPKKTAIYALACLTIAVALALQAADKPVNQPPPKKMRLTSSAFKEGQPIPAKYTCDGTNVSPPLQWSGVPPGAKSLALICDDPDAPVGTWVHWVLYDLPVAITALGEAVPAINPLPNGAQQGLNDFRKIGYGGPCPPPGNAHRYFFKVYALDTALQLKAGAAKKELLQAMEGHVVGEGQLIGKYQRK